VAIRDALTLEAARRAPVVIGFNHEDHNCIVVQIQRFRNLPGPILHPLAEFHQNQAIRGGVIAI